MDFDKHIINPNIWYDAFSKQYMVKSRSVVDVWKDSLAANRITHQITTDKTNIFEIGDVAYETKDYIIFGRRNSDKELWFMGVKLNE